MARSSVLVRIFGWSIQLSAYLVETPRQDVRRAKNTVKSGYGDQGDQKRKSVRESRYRTITSSLGARERLKRNIRIRNRRCWASCFIPWQSARRILARRRVLGSSQLLLWTHLRRGEPLPKPVAAHAGDGCPSRHRAASDGGGVGALWNMVVPTSRAGFPWRCDRRRVNHHAPTAVPRMPARIPYFRLVMSVCPP